jgi:hypothetical protein
VWMIYLACIRGLHYAIIGPKKVLHTTCEPAFWRLLVLHSTQERLIHTLPIMRTRTDGSVDGILMCQCILAR